MKNSNSSLSVAIIDYGMGNIDSVSKMVKFLNYDPYYVRKIEDLEKSDYIILPGVGSYAEAYKNLKKNGLVEGLNEHVLIRKKPFLGICLGMQLLSEKGDEGGSSEGLGWIKGETIKIKTSKNIKIPHMGWDNVEIKDRSNLYKDIYAKNPSFYFCHSYVLEPDNKSEVIANFFYDQNYVATVNKENIFGTQFHPEKSQEYGKVFLENFFKTSNVY